MIAMQSLAPFFAAVTLTISAPASAASSGNLMLAESATYAPGLPAHATGPN